MEEHSPLSARRRQPPEALSIYLTAQLSVQRCLPAPADVRSSELFMSIAGDSSCCQP